MRVPRVMVTVGAEGDVSSVMLFMGILCLGGCLWGDALAVMESVGDGGESS